MGARHTTLIVEVLKGGLKTLSKRLPREEERLHMAQYQYMVDVIKIFIRSKRLADRDGHLFCFVTRMLDIFSAAGHHQYVKGA